MDIVMTMRVPSDLAGGLTVSARPQSCGWGAVSAATTVAPISSYRGTGMPTAGRPASRLRDGLVPTAHSSDVPTDLPTLHDVPTLKVEQLLADGADRTAVLGSPPRGAPV